MKKVLFSIVLFPIALYAQDSEWIIDAKNIDPNNYYGITVANGIVGIVSSVEPMRVSAVVLNGVYDNYQRGRVSNILKSFNHVNMNLEGNGRRINRSAISDYRHVIGESILTLLRTEIPTMAPNNTLSADGR